MRNKKIIIFSIAYLVIAITTVLLFVTHPTVEATAYYSNKIALVITNESLSRSITGISGKLESLHLQYGTYMRTNYGKIIVDVQVNSSLVQEWVTQAEFLKDNQYEPYFFDEPLNVKNEDVLTVSLRAEGFPAGQYVAIWMGGNVENIENANICMYFARSSVNIKQLVICLLLLAVGVFFAFLKFEKIKISAKSFKIKYRIHQTKTGVLRYVVIIIGSVLLGILTWYLCYFFGVIQSVSIYSMFYFLICGLVMGGLILLRKENAEKPERGFFVIAFCIGLLFAVMGPTSTNITWDDQIHYHRALLLSYGNTDHQLLSAAEGSLINIGIGMNASMNDPLAINEQLNVLYDNNRFTYLSDYTYSFTSIPSYLPAAFAIWLTRILGVSFVGTVIAGRIANLLCYCIVVYLGIKQLKQGKMLAIALTLSPIILVMAGNYSYDPFCIAFVFLGVAIWLGVYQSPTEMMTAKKTLAMIICFSLGVLVKAVYFPIVLITLFLPNSKFSDRGNAVRYRVIVCAIAFGLLFSFMFPFIIRASGEAQYLGDTRGGSGVNAKEQFSLILKNPIAYLEVLFNFLFNKYLTSDMLMSKPGGILGGLSYLMSNAGITFPTILQNMLLFMVFGTWAGSNEITENKLFTPSKKIKMVTSILCFGSLCIAATSLYISFTPVGLNTINGFQYRYILPIAIPLLLIVRPNYLVNTMPKQKYNSTVLYMEASILLIGLWQYASYYFS